MGIVSNILGGIGKGAAQVVKNQWFTPDIEKAAEKKAREYYGQSWEALPESAKARAISHFTDEKAKIYEPAPVKYPAYRSDTISNLNPKTMPVPPEYTRGMEAVPVRVEDPRSMYDAARAKLGMEWGTPEFSEILRLEQDSKENPQNRFYNNSRIAKIKRGAFVKSTLNTGRAVGSSLTWGTLATGGRAAVEVETKLASMLRNTMSSLVGADPRELEPSPGFVRMKQSVLDWSKQMQIDIDKQAERLQKKSPSKLGQIAGSAGASLLLAAGIGTVARGTRAAATFLSVSESESTYRESRDAGKDPLTALLTAGVSAAGTYKLEKMGLDNILRHQPGFLVPLTGKALFEGGTELTQQAWQNTVSKIGYDRARNVWEGAFEGFVGGLFGGGAGAVSVKLFENTKEGIAIIDQIQRDSGLTRAQARVVFRDIGRAANDAYGRFLRGVRAGGEELKKEKSVPLSMFGGGEARALWNAGRAFGDEFFGERREVGRDKGVDQGTVNPKPDETVTRKGGQYVAPDGAKFAKKNQAETYVRLKRFEGASYRKYGGGVATVTKVDVNMEGYPPYEFHVVDEYGKERTHSTIIKSGSVVAWGKPWGDSDVAGNPLIPLYQGGSDAGVVNSNIDSNEEKVQNGSDEGSAREFTGVEGVSAGEPGGVPGDDRGLATDGGQAGRAGGEVLGDVGERSVEDLGSQTPLVPSTREEATPENGGDSAVPAKEERVTAKVQAEWNRQAREILSEKTDDEITEEDRAVLRRYAGAGGLEKAGESGRGLLDEYYTPEKIVTKMWGLAKKWGAVGGDILEPSVGIGRFIEYKPDWAKKLTGIELDETSARIARLLHPGAEILNQPFEKFFVDPATGKTRTGKLPQKFRLVIGNPPYGQHRGRHKFLDEPKINRYEEYFIKRGIDLLTDGGILVYIVPSSFLRSGSTKAKQEILKSAKLLEAYRLPSGVFGTTDIGTDILVFQKQESGNWQLPGDIPQTRYGGEMKESRYEVAGDRTKELSENAYFEANPEKVLGEKTIGKNRYGKEEEVITGDIGEVERIELTRTVLPRVNPSKLAYSLKYAKSNEDFIARLKKNYPIVFPVLYSDVPVGSYEQLLRVMKEDGKAAKLMPAAQIAAEAEAEKAIAKEKKAKKAEVLGGDTAPTGTSKYVRRMTDLEEKVWQARQWDGSVDDESIPREVLNYMDGKWYPDWDYYSGNIYEKIEQARRDMRSSGEERQEKLSGQLSKLMKILPEPKGIGEIYISAIDQSVREVKDSEGRDVADMFIQWAQELPRDAFEGGGAWEIRGYVRQVPVRGSDKEQNEVERKRRRRVGEKLFRQFYRNVLDPAMQQKIADRYNRLFNGTVQPDYAKMPFYAKGLSNTFKGNELTILDHQIEAVSFIKKKGVGIVAHDVGFGKTMSGIVSIMEMMQAGWAKRPVVIVPNGVYDKWIDEIRQLYPAAKIVSLKNLGAGVDGNIEIKDGQIAMMTYEALQKISFSDELAASLDLRDVMADTSGKKKTKRQKELEGAKSDEKLGLVQAGGIYSWEDFGFDAALVDELHNFKNIFERAQGSDSMKSSGEGSNIIDYRGIQGSSSARGVKMFLIAQHILKNNNGRNFIGLTATPFTNNPIEVYNMLSLVARERLRKMGLMNINDFVATFMEMKDEPVVKPGGKVENSQVVKNFQNWSALQALRSEFIDFRTGDDSPEMQAKRPKRIIKEHRLTPNEDQISYLLQAEAMMVNTAAAEGGVLKGITEMRKITISPYFSEFYSGEYPTASQFVEGSPKVKLAMSLITENKKNGKGTGQIVYMPMGTEFLSLMKEHLVKTVGYKDSEVGIISGKTTFNQKEKIKEDFNAGKAKVILGTDTIKEGLDLQKNSTDLYILGYPWRPTDLIQLHGRLWRQGNKWSQVRIHNMSIEDTIDSFMAQKLSEKTARIQNIWKDRGNVLPNEELDFEAAKLELIRDPVKRVQVEREFTTAELKLDIQGAKAELATMDKIVNEYAKAEEEIVAAESRRDEMTRRFEKDGDSFWKERADDAKETLKKAKAKKKRIEEKKEFADVKPKIEGLTAKIKKGEEDLANIEEKFKEKMKVAEASGGLNWVPKENDFGAMVGRLREENKTFFVPKVVKQRTTKEEPERGGESTSEDGSGTDVSQNPPSPEYSGGSDADGGASSEINPNEKNKRSVEKVERPKKEASGEAGSGGVDSAENPPGEKKRSVGSKRDPRLLTEKDVAVTEKEPGWYLKPGEREKPEAMSAFLEVEAERQREAEASGTAYVLSQDKIRESFPDYTPETSDSFTDFVRPWAFAQFQQAIKNDTTGEVRFTAGGSGSGKSEVALKPILDTSGVIVDTTLANTAHSLENVQIALDAGKNVTINAVYTPFGDAYEFATARAIRNVPDKDMVRTHDGFRKTMVELAKTHTNDPRVSFVLIENTIGMKSVIPEKLSNSDFLAYAEKNLHNIDDLYRIINEKRSKMDAGKKDIKGRNSNQSAERQADRQQRVARSSQKRTGGVVVADSDIAEYEDGNDIDRQKPENENVVRETENKNRETGDRTAGGRVRDYADTGVQEDAGGGVVPDIVYEDISPDDLPRLDGVDYEGGDISHIVGEIEQQVSDRIGEMIGQAQADSRERVLEVAKDLFGAPVEPAVPVESAEARKEFEDLTRRDINWIHDLVGQAHDVYLTDEKEFAPVKEFEKAADERRMKKAALDEDFTKILKKYFKLKEAEKQNVNEVLVMGDKEGKVYAKNYLEDAGLTDREISGYYSIRRAFDRAQVVLIRKMKEAGIKQQEIDDFVSRMKGYIPHRWQHRFVVKIRKTKEHIDQETGEISKYEYTESMEDFKTLAKARTAAEKLTAENSDEKTRYVVDTLDSLDVDFFQDQNLSRDKVIGLLEKVQTAEEIKEFFKESLKDIFKEKGFGQHYMRRSNVGGYDSENLTKHIADYFSGFAGYVTKMEAAPKYFDALNAVDARRQKKLHKWLRDTVAYDMGHTREWNQLKMWGFIYFLSNDISFLAVNTTQNYIMGTAELSKVMKGSEKVIRPEKEILKAQVQWATRKGLGEEERAVVDGMLKAGRLGGEMTAELMGFAHNPLYRAVTGFTKKALFNSTAFVEQNVNRVPMFLAARRVLEGTEAFADLAGIRDQVKNGRNEKTRKEAKERLAERLKDLNYEAFQIEENVHFRYGKQHRSRIQRGIGGVSFLFMHYIRSFLWSMARDLKGYEFASLTRKLMYTFVLGGALALPFAKMLAQAYEEIMDAFGWWDDDEEKEQEMTFWRTAFERGLPAAFGVDLSGRVAIDIFLLSNMAESPAKLNELTSWLGAFGGLIKRAGVTYRLADQDRYHEMLGRGLPDFLGSPVRGWYGYRYGVFSQYGNPLVDDDGMPVKYTLSEAIIRGLGFSPTRESLMWERRSAERKQTEEEKAESSTYRARIRHALVQGDIEEAKRIERDAAEMGKINPENSYIRDWVKEQTGMGDAASAEGIVRFMRLDDDQRRLYLEQSSERHKDEMEKWLYSSDHAGEVGEDAADAFYDWHEERFGKAPSKTSVNAQLRRNLEVRLVSEGTTLARFFYDQAKQSGKNDVEIAVQMRQLKKDNKMLTDDIKEYAEISGGNAENIMQFVEMSDEEIKDRFPELVY